LTSNAPSASRHVIFGIGEALFDCFDDHANLGGAPLNATLVAHAIGSKFGLSGQMISRIGRDALGEQVIAALAERGLDVSTLQIDPSLPTGRVQVQLVEGQPEYQILENVAWDQIDWDENLEVCADKASGISFGTLAQRSPHSRETIWRFLQASPNAVRFFDVNLRQSFFSAEVLRKSCELATAVKLNNEELAVVGEHLKLDSADPISHLMNAFHLQAIVLTHGEKGTELITQAGRFRGDVPQFPREDGCDPVGAGDACGATCLVGLILGWTPQRIVDNANRVGAFVASRKGATPEINADDLLPK
jgi:fructokinase